MACDCIHPPAEHDPTTGYCLRVNTTFGPCPCAGGSLYTCNKCGYVGGSARHPGCSYLAARAHTHTRQEA